MTDLSASHFHDACAARRYLESLRWPDGPVCPHCGTVNGHYKTKREGVYRCAAKECRKDFSVTVGTIFERSHIPLHKWLLGFRLMCGSKKGFSAHQLHRTLGVTYKTAWFMAHRIRESMRDLNPGPLGGENKVVEADETYVGGKAKNRAYAAPPTKEPVFALVEREGRVRAAHVSHISAKTLRNELVTQADRKSYLMTDEAPTYKRTGREFAGHGTVNHSIEEYVRGGFWHTNTVENYFSIFKRGITGTYHHVSPAHLKRYLAEFDFRYNERAALGIDDDERTVRAIKGAEGKRLTYDQPRSAEA
jgi:transposase-like protein